MHLMHLCEVSENVFLARLDGQVLHILLLGLVVDDQLRLHELKRYHEEGQVTRDMPPRAIICVDEIYILGLKGVVAYPVDMIIQDKVGGSTELSKADLVLIHEAKVSGLIWVDGINLHVGVFGE